MKGWKFESHRHMLAAKGVKTNDSYMALRSGYVLPQTKEELEMNQREDEFKGFVTRKRTPMQEFLFDREKSATVGSQRVLKLQQLMRDPATAERLQTQFRDMQQKQYEADNLRAIGDKRGANLHEMQAEALAKELLSSTTPDVYTKEAFQNTITKAEDSAVKKEFMQNASYPVQQDIAVVQGTQTPEGAKLAKEEYGKKKELDEFNLNVKNVVLSGEEKDRENKEGI